MSPQTRKYVIAQSAKCDLSVANAIANLVIVVILILLYPIPIMVYEQWGAPAVLVYLAIQILITGGAFLIDLAKCAMSVEAGVKDDLIIAKLTNNISGAVENRHTAQSKLEWYVDKHGNCSHDSNEYSIALAHPYDRDALPKDQPCEYYSFASDVTTVYSLSYFIQDMLAHNIAKCDREYAAGVERSEESQQAILQALWQKRVELCDRIPKHKVSSTASVGSLTRNSWTKARLRYLEPPEKIIGDNLSK